ncbi:MAG: hypothetical protein KJZ69_10290 [Phycisphaerales bacterium]|nr:hypothetical protein [Phycisphaerales bacterium]
MSPALFKSPAIHRRCIGGLTLALAVLSLTACSSESSIGLTLFPGDSASMEVEGSNPFIDVHNRGPGGVEVAFTAFGPGLPPDSVHLSRGSSARTLRGGGNIRIANHSDERAELSVTARNCSGLAVTQQTQNEHGGD